MEKENNILNNLPPFYVGEEVISLMNNSWNNIHGLIKNDEYIIENCFKCKCDKWMVNIKGVKYNTGSKCYCQKFGGCGFVGDSTFFLAIYFTSKKKLSYPLMTFKEIVKKEEKEVLVMN